MKKVTYLIEKLKKKHFRIFIGCIVVGIILLLEDGLLVYNKMNSSLPILGQRANGNPVSSLPKSQASAYLYNKFSSSDPLKLANQGKVYVVNKKDIGANIDYEMTINKLYGAGRDGNFLHNILTQNKALLGFSNTKLYFKMSKPLLLIKVLELEKDINTTPQPQMPDFSGDMSRTIPQRDGIKVLSTQLSQILINNIFNPPVKPITVPTQIVAKKFDTYNLDMLRKQAQDYTNEPISISSAGLVFTLTPKDLKSMLTVAEQPDPVNPKKTIITLLLNRVKLSRKLEPFATQVESVTHAEFNDDNSATTAIYSQFYTNTRRLVDISSGSSGSTRVLGVSTPVPSSGSEKVVYLTFDDGPNIIYHPLLLDILKEKNAKATFYLVGSNSTLYPSTTKRTVAEGHAIEDHSLTHADLPKLLPNQIMDEIKTTRDILNGFLGGDKKITLFRPPFGDYNSIVIKSATSLGLRQELWTVDPKDWSEPTTDELVQKVVKNVQNGSVILLHSNHFSTVKALPIIIDKIKAMGYSFKLQS